MCGMWSLQYTLYVYIHVHVHDIVYVYVCTVHSAVFRKNVKGGMDNMGGAYIIKMSKSQGGGNAHPRPPNAPLVHVCIATYVHVITHVCISKA